MANMIPISTVTVGSGGASSIDFVNIPQIYTDLVIKTSSKSNRGTGDYIVLRFNGDSGSNYKARYIQGDGTNASSTANDPYTYIHLVTTEVATNVFISGDVTIPNYGGSNQKSVSIDAVAENNATTARDFLVAGLWTGTSPINSITILPLYGTGFTQYSSATLYGIRKY